MTDAFMSGFTAALLFMAAGVLAFLAVAAAARLLRDPWRRFRKFGKFDKVVVLVGLSIFAYHGGAKYVVNAGADAGIALVGVSAEYDPTNNVTSVDVEFTGSNVTADTPVSVRNAESETWRELVKYDATVTSDLATNVLSFAVSGDETTNLYWWVGVDAPGVVISSEGITITHFEATSHCVEIAWTCDDTNATEFAVQWRLKGETGWVTAGTVPNSMPTNTCSSVPRYTVPISSLMPNLVTMLWASCVARCRSLVAPLVLSSSISFSAAWPPSIMQISCVSCLRVEKSVSWSGRTRV